VLNAGIYGDHGHIVLFLMTVMIITLIVIALIRWIEHLSELAMGVERDTLLPLALQREG
jgi:hypothetical protein